MESSGEGGSADARQPASGSYDSRSSDESSPPELSPDSSAGHGDVSFTRARRQRAPARDRLNLDPSVPLPRRGNRNTKI